MKLKPCPFCGGHGVRVSYNHGGYYAWCIHCGCSLERCETGDDAREKWNIRATDPLIEELAEKFADHYCNDELLKEMVNAFEEIVRCLSHGLQDCRASVTAKKMLQKYHEQVDKQ